MPNRSAAEFNKLMAALFVALFSAGATGVNFLPAFPDILPKGNLGNATALTFVFLSDPVIVVGSRWRLTMMGKDTVSVRNGTGYACRRFPAAPAREAVSG